MTILSTFGGTSGVDTGDIGHSLRFRNGASAYLSKTVSISGNRKKWSLNVWLKRGALAAGTSYTLLGTNYYNTAGGTSTGINIADGVLDWTDYSSGYVYRRSPSALLRDPTSAVNLLFVFDSDNATAADRAIIYINGNRVTSFAASVDPSLGYQTYWNAASSTAVSGGTVGDHLIGAANLVGIGGIQSFYDGYLSRIAFVDGSALTPSSFGYFNTEINEWVSKSQSAVKAAVDAGGTNSFMLDFDDATSLTTLGYDKSIKGNNWTLNNFSLTAGATYDHTLDVPGNSFATWNTLDKGSSFVVDYGGLQANLPSGNQSVRTTIPIPESDGWYVEVLAGANVNLLGVANRSANLGNWLGSDANAWSYNSNNGQKYTNGVGADYGATYTTGDLIGIKFARSNGSLEFFKNGVSQGVAFTGLSGELFFAAGSVGASSGININFGQAPLHASATYHSAAGGYFRYAPPTGYKALCQRNMPDPAILNPKNGFVSVIATEDNIYSTLASARSGWTDYVDILKNRAASESWAWQFSHDSSNEYAVAASSLVRQTKRTQSGSNNWVGYSIRIGATYGTAAGSVSHSNGVATTITHNVGKSARQLILLFNRAGGSAVPVYHPDLTSGELLDLCTTAADAASTAITSVGTNSFQIGSATATGTYDYLVCSEISQFFDLGKWTGNASADGAYYDAGHKPKMLYAKALSTTDDHRVYDDLRPGYNVQGGVVLANTNAAETTAAEMDITAFGMKARITTTPNAAQTYVTASWASSSGKYSLGR